MLDRFNFYDVYAYLLPGLTWLGLSWLPYCFFTGRWPSEALFSAFVGIVGGYVLGHLLYQVTASTFSTKRNGRYDSTILLDNSCSDFSSQMKTRIRARIRELFNLHLEGPSDTDPVRQDAFLMARAFLARKKEVYYVEQFQGMYTLARGLGGAFLLTACNYAGWAVWMLAKNFRYAQYALAIVAAALVVIALSCKRTRIFVWFVGFGASLFLLGEVLACTVARSSWVILAPGAAALVAGLLLLRAYRRLATEFARSVYIALAVTEPSDLGTGQGSSEQQDR